MTSVVSGILHHPYTGLSMPVKWVKVYGGWLDQTPRSRTHGRIYTQATMDAILAQYPQLRVTAG